MNELTGQFVQAGQFKMGHYKQIAREFIDAIKRLRRSKGP